MTDNSHTESDQNSDDTDHETPHELVDKWRRQADAYPSEIDDRAKAAAVAVQLCADELERSLHPATSDTGDDSEEGSSTC